MHSVDGIKLIGVADVGDVGINDNSPSGEFFISAQFK
jgi:hypothetical protein